MLVSTQDMALVKELSPRTVLMDDDRIMAIEQYGICRRLLSDELGIEPEPETGALFEQIKAGRIEKGAGVFHGTR